jgi:hypothetical protein
MLYPVPVNAPTGPYSETVATDPTDLYDEVIASSTARLPDTARLTRHDEMTAAIIARRPSTARLITDWSPSTDDPERWDERRQCSICQRVTALKFMGALADETDGLIYAEACTACIGLVVNWLRAACIGVDENDYEDDDGDYAYYQAFPEARLFEQANEQWVWGVERAIRAKLPATGHLASVMYPGADDPEKRDHLVECTFCGAPGPLGEMSVLVDDGNTSDTDHPVYAAVCFGCSADLRL